MKSHHPEGPALTGVSKDAPRPCSAVRKTEPVFSYALRFEPNHGDSPLSIKKPFETPIQAKAKDVAQSSKRIVESYLVACARLGDRAAQEQLVARYQNKFLRHAYRLLGDTEQAKDAVQDGWLEIVRNLPRLKDDGAFAAWAYRIVTRRCAKQIAGLKRNREILEGVSCTCPATDGGEAESERAADRGPVHEALARLPAKQRAAVALFYLEEMSVAEVAVALEIPVGTVKSRLMHARQKLRAALEGGNDGQAG